MYRSFLKAALLLTIFCFNSSLIAAKAGNAMQAYLVLVALVFLPETSCETI
jgi:hypothetical protein